jgi:putative endonuclease
MRGKGKRALCDQPFAIRAYRGIIGVMIKKATRRAAFVYLLRCADGTIYTGWTFDVMRRVRDHQRGRGARYTRARRPVELIYHERVPSRRAAMRREVAIKRMSRQRKLRIANCD